MQIVLATVKTKVLDGIEILDVPVGKMYLVDLDSLSTVQWFNEQHGQQRNIPCVRDVEEGGYLPVDVLEIGRVVLVESWMN